MTRYTQSDDVALGKVFVSVAGSIELLIEYSLQLIVLVEFLNYNMEIGIHKLSNDHVSSVHNFVS